MKVQWLFSRIGLHEGLFFLLLHPASEEGERLKGQRKGLELFQNSSCEERKRCYLCNPVRKERKALKEAY